MLCAVTESTGGSPAHSIRVRWHLSHLCGFRGLRPSAALAWRNPPTAVETEEPDGPRLCSGSGARIRTWDLQVMSGLLEHRPLDDHHRASTSRSWHDGMHAS